MGKNLYRLINSLLLTFTGLFGWGTQMGISGASMKEMVIPMTVALILLFAFAGWCQAGIKGRIVMACSVTAAFGVTAGVIGIDNMVLFGSSYLAGLAGNTHPEMEWGIVHECMQAAALALGCFLAQFLVEKLLVLRIVVTAGLFAVLLQDLFLTRDFSHMGVVCIFMYGVITYIEWTQRVWKKQKTNRRKQYVVWLLPFLAVYFLLFAMTPAPEKPYDWRVVKEAYVGLREICLKVSQNWFGTDREDFATGVTGFSEDGRLLGGVLEDDREVMYVQGQKSLKTNVYLMGKIYDTFSGKQWTQTSEITSDDRTLDALETIYAVSMYEEDGTDKYIHQTKLNVCYQYFHTGYLFAPLKTVAVAGEDREYSVVGGNLVFDRRKGYGTAYQASFVQLNIDHPLFYKFLESDRQEQEAVWKQVQKEYGKKSGEQYDLSRLNAHREEVKAVYGQECSLSKEVGDWLSEVTKDAHTDIERLRAIEAALQEFTYTKTPGRIPEEVTCESEFLDYFLLENKQGFCSYFATAFVLLARAEGLPARYVEGFCVPVKGEERTIVYSRMAHAWPEVYMEGVGWIPFEPTPGYEEIRYTPWEMKDLKQHFLNNDLEDMEEEETDSSEQEEKLQEESIQAADRNRGRFLRILSETLVIVLLMCGLLLWADRRWRAKRYRKWSLEERFLAEIQKNMKMLAFLGYERKENETLWELQQRAWAVMEEEDGGGKPQFRFLQYYEEVVYGHYPVQEEMLHRAAQEREYLLAMLKKWKPLAYLYCKICNWSEK